MTTASSLACQLSRAVLTSVPLPTSAFTGMSRVACTMSAASIKTHTLFTENSTKSFVAGAQLGSARSMAVARFSRWHVYRTSCVNGACWTTVSILTHASVNIFTNVRADPVGCVSTVRWARSNFCATARSSVTRSTAASAINIVAHTTPTALLWFTRTYY